jgi:hypothetical protein
MQALTGESSDQYGNEILHRSARLNPPNVGPRVRGEHDVLVLEGKRPLRRGADLKS